MYVEFIKHSKNILTKYRLLIMYAAVKKGIAIARPPQNKIKLKKKTHRNNRV